MFCNVVAIRLVHTMFAAYTKATLIKLLLLLLLLLFIMHGGSFVDATVNHVAMQLVIVIVMLSSASRRPELNDQSNH